MLTQEFWESTGCPLRLEQCGYQWLVGYAGWLNIPMLVNGEQKVQVLYYRPGLLVEFPLKEWIPLQAGRVFFAINEREGGRIQLFIGLFFILKKLFQIEKRAQIISFALKK